MRIMIIRQSYALISTPQCLDIIAHGAVNHDMPEFGRRQARATTAAAAPRVRPIHDSNAGEARFLDSIVKRAQGGEFIRLCV